jgi:hypothetical protein
MTEPWEKYVEQAAVSLDPAAFDRSIENHDGYIRQFRRARATELARGVLAVVGPLIVEDTRERLVAAAARAVEREAPPAADLKHLRCPYCGGELFVETETVSGFGTSWDSIDRIECCTFECGATWDRSGVALLKPRKLCGTCETSQRTADDLGGKVPPHDKVWGGKCPGDPA